MTRYAFLFFLVMSMANLYAGAEPDEDTYSRLARISYMEGHVSFQHTSDVDWTAAVANLPLQPGDRIYTGPEGKAEIQFDEGSVLRLAEKTDVQFLSLREDIIQVRVLTGLSSLSVSSDVEFEIDTPAAAFIVLSKGKYRFDTKDSGDTDAIARKGEMEIVGQGFEHRIQSGELISVTAGGNSSYNLSHYGQRDGWDEWTDRRDVDNVARNSREHIPDDVYIGASDLDRNGRWVTVESYGTAWVPFSVGVSWTPYSVGRWCYRSGWGWTWISYEPWGWLPYHYGRWHRSVRYGWCWLPGPSFSFNFWSPGLVTFYYGPTWVSWGALGPGDYYCFNNYHYNRRRHHHHMPRMKRLHRRSPGDSINRHVRGAFRTVGRDRFRNGSFRHGESQAIATKNGYRKIDQPWNSGTLVHERLAVQPTSRSFSADPDRKATRSKITNPKTIVVHATPTARAGKQGGYIKIPKTNAASRTASRSKSKNNSGSGNAGIGSKSGPGKVLRNSQSTGVRSVQKQANNSLVNRGQEESRSVRSNNRSKSSQNGNSGRTPPQSISRQSSDHSAPTRSPAPGKSVEQGDGKRSSQPRINRSNSRSITSVNPARSTPQKSRTTSIESMRINTTTRTPRPSNVSSRSSGRSLSSSSSSGRQTSTYSSSYGRTSSSNSSSSVSSGRSSSGNSRATTRTSRSSNTSARSSSRNSSPSNGRSSSGSSSSSVSSGKSSSGNSSSGARKAVGRSR